jgi:hypothetical protein
MKNFLNLYKLHMFVMGKLDNSEFSKGKIKKHIENYLALRDNHCEQF